jgi:N-acetyl-anhydromuramyl-L-alanine amidase AmpD
VNKYNQEGIGICLVGNFENTRPTPRQRQALKRLLASLQREYRISSRNIIGHNDVKTSTLCPGRHFSVEDFIRSELHGR